MENLCMRDVVNIDLNKGLSRTYAGMVLATGDNMANCFGAALYRGGDAVDITGYAVTGYFIRKGNAETVLIQGKAKGNEAIVELPQACYASDGGFSLAIKVSGADVTATVRVVDGAIRLTQTGTMIDPGDVVPSLDELFAQIEAMEGATAEAQAAADTANQAAASVEGFKTDIQGDVAALSEDIFALSGDESTHDAWVSGSINSSTGAIQTSATRIRTSWFVRGGVMRVEPAEGYKYMLFAYTKEDGSFVGIWDGASIAKGGTWLSVASDIASVSKDYLFRIVLAKADDGSIPVDDGANLKLVCTTDTTLSQEGLSADAKAVGVYTEAYADSGVVDLCKLSQAGDYTNNGVTFTKNLNGTWTIDGTASNNTFCAVLRGFPVEENKVFYIEASTPMRLYWKLADGGEETIDINTRKYVKSPKNAVSFLFGFYARYGVAYDNVLANCKFVTVPPNDLNRGVLSPSGDYTDRTEDVEFMLQTYGECRLMAGDYYVREVNMPDGSIVSGCGRNTRVYLYGDGAGNCFVLGSGCTIKDVELIDPYDESVIVPTIDNNRNGILFEGATKKGTITNCHIRNFNGSGIKLVDTGFATMNGMNISDCDIEKCYFGINIASKSEFHRFANVSMTQNRFGCVNNGGNNQFSCCGFNSNIHNFVIDNSAGDKTNNSHGACVGCNFHHANSEAIKIVGSTSGYLFSGCSIDDAGIIIKNSTRIIFDGCNFMGGFSENGGLSVDGQGVHDGDNEGNLIIFSGSSFRKSFESVTLTNGADRGGIKFVGCFYQDGTEVNP